MDKGKKAVRKLGKRLKELRLARKLSQQELAVMLDVEQSYVSGIERGVYGPSFPKLYKVAEALNVTISELCEDI